MKYHSEAAPSVQLSVLYITNLSERRTGLGMDIFVWGSRGGYMVSVLDDPMLRSSLSLPLSPPSLAPSLSCLDPDVWNLRSRWIVVHRLSGTKQCKYDNDCINISKSWEESCFSSNWKYMTRTQEVHKKSFDKSMLNKQYLKDQLINLTWPVNINNTHGNENHRQMQILQRLITITTGNLFCAKLQGCNTL